MRKANDRRMNYKINTLGCSHTPRNTMNNAEVKTRTWVDLVILSKK